ncbi:MAG: spike base protein, RCAP_Rcc01079 family [Planctomycetota bacterium]|jgi:hypothetical protein
MSVPPFSSAIPTDAEAVTLTSDFPLKPNCYGLYVGTTGNVVVEYRENPDVYVTYPTVAASFFLPGRFSLVRSTANGTSASGIVAQYVNRSFSS